MRSPFKVLTGVLVLFTLFTLCFTGSAQEGDQNPWANCEICKQVMDDTELLEATDYNLHDWDQGVIFTLILKKPELMPRFRKVGEEDQKISQKFLAMRAGERAGKLCDICDAYFKFCDRGLKEERIQTPTGMMSITSTKDPVLLRDVQHWAAGVRKMVSEVDAQMLSVSAEKSCSGTCSKSASTGSKSTGGTCCGSKECSKSKTFPDKQTAMQVMETMQKEMQNCFLCKMYVEKPEMMTVAKHKIIRLKNGVAFVSTVQDMNNLAKYHDFEKIYHAKIDEFRNVSCCKKADIKICSICQKFSGLEAKGALMDWSLTDTGAMTVMVSTKPELVEEIHAMADWFEQLESLMAQQSM